MSEGGFAVHGWVGGFLVSEAVRCSLVPGCCSEALASQRRDVGIPEYLLVSAMDCPAGLGPKEDLGSVAEPIACKRL